MEDEGKTIHGTCVAWGHYAALIRGDSGSGKSDLAFRFAALQEGECNLVADDRVFLKYSDNKLIVSGPDSLKGLIELRGVGLVQIPYIESAELKLVIDLVDLEDVPRMQVPYESNCYQTVMGTSLPHAKLYSFEPSAPNKVLALIKQSIADRV